MSWTKLKPIKGGFGGCLNCGYQYDVAPLDMIIAVGFGTAIVTKNGMVIYNELDECHDNWDNAWTVTKAEEEALRDPDNDWRIVLEAPLSMRVYQRHEKNTWVLVKKGMGFA